MAINRKCDGVERLERTAEFLPDFPKSIEIYHVESFPQVREDSVELAVEEDQVSGSAAALERTLSFRQKSLFEMAVEMFGANASEDLPGDVAKGDSSVVITKLLVPFPIVKMDDRHSPDILRKLSLAPEFLNYRHNLTHQPVAAGLVDFDRNRVEILESGDHGVSRELFKSWFSGPQSNNKRNDLLLPNSLLSFSLGSGIG
nr:unnamed protein product [Spirometra erinaceieuropaei]